MELIKAEIVEAVESFTVENLNSVVLPNSGDENPNLGNHMMKS